MCSFLYHCNDFSRTWLCIWVMGWVSYKKQELLTFQEHLSSPPAFCWGPWYQSFSFLCYLFMCLYVLSSMLLCGLRFLHEKGVQFVFTSCCLCEGWGLYIICVCLRIVVSNTYSGVFFLFCLLLGYHTFPVTLDCPFWLPLRYSLTFILYSIINICYVIIT